MTLVVADTGPLNYLHLIGQLEILPALYGEVLVPPAVLREMAHPHAPPEARNHKGHVRLRGDLASIHRSHRRLIVNCLRLGAPMAVHGGVPPGIHLAPLPV